MGASLIPDYFTEKVNLFVGLAPVASNANVTGPSKESAKYMKEIELALLEAKIYNLFPPMPLAMETVLIVCDLPYLKDVCKSYLKSMNNQAVDNPQAAKTFMSNEPSGQSYRTFVYYSQSMVSGKVTLYDYGSRENKKIYGSEEPPLLPLNNYAVPSALFSGSLDEIADRADVAWLVEQIKPHVIFHKEYELDHFSFLIAKDMSFFTEDAVNLIK